MVLKIIQGLYNLKIVVDHGLVFLVLGSGITNITSDDNFTDINSHVNIIGKVKYW